MNRREMRRRGGFTMVELLVTIGIMSLLLSLLLPAVQSSREAARRTGCLNNLRQFGVALANFESLHEHLPGGHNPLIKSGQGAHTGHWSAHSVLLPQLDQAAVYQSVDLSQGGPGVLGRPEPLAIWDDLNTLIPVFQCPSDGVRKGTNYRVCTGASGQQHGVGDRAAADRKRGAFHHTFWSGMRMSDARDGTSQTAAASESMQSDSDAGAYSSPDVVQTGLNSVLSAPATEEQLLELCRVFQPTRSDVYAYTGWAWVQASYYYTTYNHVLPPNSPIPNCTEMTAVKPFDAAIDGTGGHFLKASSWHPGGVHVLFLDGAVRFVSNGVDLNVWRAAGTVSGEEVGGEL